MSTLAPAVVAAPEPPASAAAVMAFLAANPLFLADNPDLYRVLAPPRRIHGEQLADHMAAMLGAERRRLRTLEAEMSEQLEAGRAAQALGIRSRLAVLALMRAADVAETIEEEMPALLGIETCTLLFESPRRRGQRQVPRGTVARLLGAGRDARVRPAPTEAELLHREAAPLVARDALVRVPTVDGTPALLALGTRDRHALPSRQAQGPLLFLGRAVGAALAR